ncbi:unnamed protein product [Ceratitis capitata]|uniref:(Mediterranean fruit fly) hypothetical protein n=1 Tax=Ceratitis capitata TaxID=7213 RepID=A0A811VBP4_CERCA|nr:unnamed protein product [Ceratitis capitata]
MVKYLLECCLPIRLCLYLCDKQQINEPVTVIVATNTRQQQQQQQQQRTNEYKELSGKCGKTTSGCKEYLKSTSTGTM